MLGVPYRLRNGKSVNPEPDLGNASVGKRLYEEKPWPLRCGFIYLGGG